MIAFGHNLRAPFFEKTDESTYLPILTCVAEQKELSSFINRINFNQNQGREVLLSTDLNFNETIKNQKWIFEVKDIISFYWESGSNIIRFHVAKDGNDILSRYWFLHTLLPIYLTVENKSELIHAGSVEIHNKPVLFIAPSYGGKSTLTDHFIQQGHVMISDDRVPLRETNSEILVTSSYHYHRPYRQMEDLGIKVDKLMTKTKKLHIIYVLEETSPEDDIIFTRLKGIETFKALQYNFDFTLPLNKARSFELIAKIASSVPIYRISIPWDLDRLDEVYEKICAHSITKENL